MKKILFVCTGNTCRSPMAAALARSVFAKENLNYEFDSRGTYVFASAEASVNAIRALQKSNVSLNEHVSKQLELKDIKESDLILTMTNDHKVLLHNLASDYSSRIFTLSEYIDNINKDVMDPYGGSSFEYETCARELNYYIEKLLVKLKEKEN